MADRVVVMNNGVIEQVGTPNEIYGEPTNRFVADFIGVMNFIEGEVGDGHVRRRWMAGCALRGTRPAGRAAGTEATRPSGRSASRLLPDAAGREPHGRHRRDDAYHGLDLQVHVRTALVAAPLLVRVTAEQAERRPVAPGDTVEIGWSAADTRIFAKD